MNSKKFAAVALLLGLATYAAPPITEVLGADLPSDRAGSVCVKVNGHVMKYSSHNIPYGVIHYGGAAIEFVGGRFYTRNSVTMLKTPKNHRC
jgi:hypothetical protein